MKGGLRFNASSAAFYDLTSLHGAGREIARRHDPDGDDVAAQAVHDPLMIPPLPGVYSLGRSGYKLLLRRGERTTTAGEAKRPP